MVTLIPRRTLCRGGGACHSYGHRQTIADHVYDVCRINEAAGIDLCVYDVETGIQLPAPDSKCKCVAQVID